MATSKFPIYRLEDRSTTEIGREDDGRFFKYWANGNKLGRCLFKAAFPYDSSDDRHATGEAATTPRFRQQHRMDWREKVAAQLGKLLGLPMAQTELATIYIPQDDTWISGSISVDYTPPVGELISLRRFLSQVDPNYDSAYSESFEDGYNVSNVMFYLHQNSVGLPLGWNGIEGIADGADLLVGYLLLDAWLGATDRHDENLEIAISESGYFLCPTFDHGDCLGSKLAREEQQSGNFADPRLMESCWWETQTIDERSETIEITTIRALEVAANIRPSAAIIWLERLSQIARERVGDIFSRIPDDLMTLNETRFSIELLEYNRQNIFNLKLRSSDLANDN